MWRIVIIENILMMIPKKRLISDIIVISLNPEYRPSDRRLLTVCEFGL